MAVSFGAAGATGRVVSSLTAGAAARTYSCFVRRDGAGGGGFGRIFDHGAVVSLLEYDSVSSGTYIFEQAHSVANGRWYFTRPSGFGGLAIAYDNSSNSNNPTVYVNGSSASLTEELSPGGTATSPSGNLYIGNRDNGGTYNRNWEGAIAEFAVWDRILTADELKAVSLGYSPLLFPASLVEYVPLVRDMVSRVRTAPTTSGLTVEAHPRVFYPRRRQVHYKTAGGAPSSISGTCALTFDDGSSTLTGTGTLTGSAALTFDDGTSALTGSGALAGSAALTFDDGSSVLTGSGALAGSCAVTFTLSASTGAEAPISGTCALTFDDGSSTLTGSGSLAGACALTFDDGTSVLTGTGSLGGACALTFDDGTSTLTGSGLLAGSAAMVFAASVAVASDATLVGTWSNVIVCQSVNQRIDCQSANRRIDL